MGKKKKPALDPIRISNFDISGEQHADLVARALSMGYSEEEIQQISKPNLLRIALSWEPRKNGGAREYHRQKSKGNK